MTSSGSFFAIPLQSHRRHYTTGWIILPVSAPLSTQICAWGSTLNSNPPPLCFLSPAQSKHHFLYNCTPVCPFKHNPRPSLCDALRSAPVIFVSRVELNLALTVPLLITTYSADHTGLQWRVSRYRRCCCISPVTLAKQGECVCVRTRSFTGTDNNLVIGLLCLPMTV